MTAEQRAWLDQLPVGGRIRNRLRIAMVLMGIDNSELARRCGLQDQYVSAVATGRLQNISLKNAQRIAKALDMKLEELFPGEGPHDDDGKGDDPGAASENQ